MRPPWPPECRSHKASTFASTLSARTFAIISVTEPRAFPGKQRCKSVFSRCSLLSRRKSENATGFDTGRKTTAPRISAGASSRRSAIAASKGIASSPCTLQTSANTGPLRAPFTTCTGTARSPRSVRVTWSMVCARSPGLISRSAIFRFAMYGSSVFFHSIHASTGSAHGLAQLLDVGLKVALELLGRHLNRVCAHFEVKLSGVGGLQALRHLAVQPFHDRLRQPGRRENSRVEHYLESG